MNAVSAAGGAGLTPLRVLIVDDEELARRGVAARLARGGGVEVVGECESGEDAVAAIGALSPDVVFLDVQMPELDGFEVVARVGPDRMPPVVFVTAYDAHALRAFDAHALDYLLKPIDDERFAEAVERVRQRVAERRVGAVVRQLAAALAELGGPAARGGAPVGRAPTAPRDRLIVRDGGRVTFVDVDDVDWVAADGDYVRLHVRGRGHLVRETIAAMAARLPAGRFVRIHRSAIVNVDRVRELHPHTNRELRVVLRDGTRLKVSRGYRDQIAALFAGAR